MKTSFKLFTGTALALCLPVLALTPVNAKPIQQSAQQPSARLVAQVDSMVGRIVSISGTTVEVLFPNRESQKYQVSSSDSQAWKLTEGSYVLVRGDKIVDVAQLGTIVGFAGSVFTVRLDKGELVNTRVSRGMSGALNLRVGGTRVVVSEGQIVALGRDVESLSTTSVIRTNRTESLFQDGQAITPAPLRPTEVRRTVEVEEKTVEPEPQKPVRGLW